MLWRLLTSGGAVDKLTRWWCYTRLWPAEGGKTSRLTLVFAVLGWKYLTCTLRTAAVLPACGIKHKHINKHILPTCFQDTWCVYLDVFLCKKRLLLSCDQTVQTYEEYRRLNSCSCFKAAVCLSFPPWLVFFLSFHYFWLLVMSLLSYKFSTCYYLSSLWSMVYLMYSSPDWYLPTLRSLWTMPSAVRWKSYWASWRFFGVNQSRFDWWQVCTDYRLTWVWMWLVNAEQSYIPHHEKVCTLMQQHYFILFFHF